MYIDTHCHLQFEQFQEDLAMVIGNAKKAGVKRFVVPGVDRFSSELAVSLADSYKGQIFAAVGFHPYEASKNPDMETIERLILSRTQADAVVAIGECGLDYHLFKGEHAGGKKQQQKLLFSEHIHLASRFELPLIMHCREAFDDFFAVLDGNGSNLRGVIHCFSGGLQEIRDAKARGLYLGIDGNVTYSKQLASMVPHIPLDMLILETDAPYLTPVPHRGLRNEPKYIPLVARKIASLQNLPVQNVMEITTNNACKLFGWYNKG